MSRPESFKASPNLNVEAVKPTAEHLAALREQYRQHATLAAEASADIALYEEKCRAARQRYEEAKARRDSLKQQIAKHPLS